MISTQTVVRTMPVVKFVWRRFGKRKKGGASLSVRAGGAGEGGSCVCDDALWKALQSLGRTVSLKRRHLKPQTR